MPRLLPVPLLAGLLLILAASGYGGDKMMLAVIGLLLGITLYHGGVGFTGAYRRFLLQGETAGMEAQILMLAAASLLFAPSLASGSIFGQPVYGAVAPVGVSMLLGAFLFGIGMQLGGGCGSGTLYTAGGGNLRMLLTLLFFSIGGFWGSLDLPRWRRLPEMPGLSLGDVWGYGTALVFQLSLLLALYLLLRRFGKRTPPPDAPERGVKRLLHGPWPLFAASLALALLNFLTLAIDGAPWGITWGFTLWAGKAATLVGWDPSTSAYWLVGYRMQALDQSLLADTTSLMDFAIIIGALLAAILAGRLKPSFRIPLPHLLASILGGLMLGYGARLAYGCNIGAFFSGVASFSLHGWLWIVAALPGNALGVRLRPLFKLEN